QLAEPYVTTRAEGSGLGLAIVKKIMEDHAGDLLLESRAGGGACVRLVFGAAPSDAAALEDGTDDDVTAAGEAARDGA
ncbi:MAG: ATP-binding protein, partial [Alphaproteobacteria bacterium]